MTRPGPPPSWGRHAAPDDDARLDEAAPTGRHAAPDQPRRRHAAPELDGYPEPPPRRRHSAPDDAPNGAGHDRPVLGNGAGYRRPDPTPTGYPTPGANGVGHHRAGPSPGHASGSGLSYQRPETGPGDAAAPGYGYDRPEPSPNGYAPPGASGVGYGRAGPGAGDAPAPGYGYDRSEPSPNRYANGVGHHRAEPGPEANGIRYHRPEPGAHRYGGAEPAPHPWPEVNGYHLETPAPPAVNGYRLEEPVAPVTGFPYTAPPSTPIAYPVNGHGVDAAERDAASWPASGRAASWPASNQATSWPVDGQATSWPVYGLATELDRPPDPQIAVVPLEDEETQVLHRPAPAPAGKQPEPPHPPRAVVRRRRARRKALEWPFLIVFAVVSAFLIRQFVVQTFYIPSASMHETLIEGDRVLVNKVGYHLHDIHRGDVVVFRKPPNLNVSEDDLIKRVVGLPGETVQGRGGTVYVNGAPLDEPYVEPLCHGTGDFARVTVPPGTLWVMGDNRCNSSDSRVFGPIDQHLVVGRAFVLAWPVDRLSWL
jgi:signal peptidase I